MKLIHCADLHLDSRMTAHLDRERARERRGELLTTFTRMVDYAADHHVTAILIAGDLFDTRSISAAARNTVLHAITEHPGMLFFYLRGNHDSDSFLSSLPELPENLKLFSHHWQSYRIGSVVIHGLELNRDNCGTMSRTFTARTEDFNIVMLHGQEADSSANSPDSIDWKSLRNRSIDYLALGHIHSYHREVLDPRGIRCYSGCLEGRGFDECGPHGFVLLEIDEDTGSCRDTFIPFASRCLHTIPVDVSDCMTSSEMIQQARIAAEASGCRSRDLVKFVLTGEPDVTCEMNLSLMSASLASLAYCVKVSDETSPRISPEDYIMDESLRGEFVRMILEDKTLSESDRMTILRYGLQALAGEEVCG